MSASTQCTSRSSPSRVYTSKSRRKAFTLIEVMAVLVIIAILTMLIVSLWKVASRQSLEAKAKSELQKIQFAIEEYRIKNGQPPMNLSAIVSTLEGGINVATNVPIDPWGQAYRYEQRESTYRLYSMGADKATGVASNMMDDIDAGK